MNHWLRLKVVKATTKPLSKWRRYNQTFNRGRFDAPKKRRNVLGTEWFWPTCRQIWECRALATGQTEPDDGQLGVGAVERRQLTVVACDMAGLAVLAAQLDLEDLREVTTACHRCCTEIIEQYRGYVANYSTDGILAYFGYPQADEHDAERAVQAGLALVKAIPNLPTASGVPVQMGIGIATGLVVAGGQAAAGAAQTVTAVGGTPNLAARLPGLAGPDQVVIDAATRRAIGGQFACRDLGTVELESMPEAVPVWQVLSENRAVSRFEARRSGSTPWLVVPRKWICCSAVGHRQRPATVAWC